MAENLSDRLVFWEKDENLFRDITRYNTTILVEDLINIMNISNLDKLACAAIRNNNISMLKFLLLKGANLNLIAVEALNSNNDFIFNYLKDKDINTDAMAVIAAYRGYNKIVRDLVPLHVLDINLVVKHAAAGGNLEIIKYVYSLGMYKLDMFSVVNIGARCNYLEIVKFALDKLGPKLDMNCVLCVATYNNSSTVFIYCINLTIKSHRQLKEYLNLAAARGSLDIVVYLVNNHKEVNLEDINDAAILAAKYGNEATTLYLINKGAVSFNDIIDNAYIAKAFSLVEKVTNIKEVIEKRFT
jgi:hypothetical protein